MTAGPARDYARLARQLAEVVAELDQVVRQVRGVEAGVRSTVGATATGADRRMLSCLGRTAASTHGAQEALSSAASGLRGLR